jgi:hypothetical protein
MKKIFPLFLFIFIIGVGQLAAQRTNLSPTHNQRSICYVSFNGVHSLSDVEKLRDSISALPGVIQFKPRFKPENNTGEIMLSISEKLMSPESRSVFDAVRVKKILGGYGYDVIGISFQPIDQQ